MDAIYLLIPLTLVLLVIAIGIFFWAVNSEQYSDLDKEASRILFEEKEPEEEGFEEKESVEKETGINSGHSDSNNNHSDRGSKHD